MLLTLIQECDEVIHLIPEKTVHQRVPLKAPEIPISAPSSHSIQSAPTQTTVQSAQSNRFQSQLDATIHEQRVTHMQMQAVPAKPEIPQSRLAGSASAESLTEVQDDYFEEYYDEVIWF